MDTPEIPLETLLDFHEGRLTPEAADAVRRRLAAGDLAANSESQALAALVACLSDSRFEAPSPEAIARATGLLRQRRPRPSLVEFLGQRVPLPSFGGSLSLAARGGAPEPIQLLFDAGGHDIDLWAERNAEGKYHVIGQVRSPSREEALIPEWVAVSGAEARGIVPEASGEFHLPLLPPGLYDVRIYLKDAVIHLSDVALPGE